MSAGLSDFLPLQPERSDELPAQGARFLRDGFVVMEDLLPPDSLVLAQRLVEELVARFQAGEAAVRAAGVSMAEKTANPGLPRPEVAIPEAAPFLIGDLLALDPRFAAVFAAERIWQYAAVLLGCAQEEVVFHFSNVTRKPAFYGPPVSWHRDGQNTYFAASGEATVRLLIPLQAMSAANGGTEVASYSHLFADESRHVRHCPAVPAGGGLALHAQTLHGGGPNRSEQERDVFVLQFGVAGSVLTHQAEEVLSLSGHDGFLRMAAAAA